jgi:hypothetical protein
VLGPGLQAALLCCGSSAASGARLRFAWMLVCLNLCHKHDAWICVPLIMPHYAERLTQALPSLKKCLARPQGCCCVEVCRPYRVIWVTVGLALATVVVNQAL